MKFSEACAIAINQAREIGCAFYVHESPSMWDVTAEYQRGWLFKAYPGGRKIVSTAGKRILESESRPTLRGTDVLSCGHDQGIVFGESSWTCAVCGEPARRLR